MQQLLGFLSEKPLSLCKLGLWPIAWLLGHYYRIRELNFYLPGLPVHGSSRQPFFALLVLTHVYQTSVKQAISCCDSGCADEQSSANPPPVSLGITVFTIYSIALQFMRIYSNILISSSFKQELLFLLPNWLKKEQFR